MRKSFFIVNPASGNKKAVQLVALIEAIWSENEIPHEIYVTENHEDISRGVMLASKFNASEIIVLGGDGTILAVVNAQHDKSIPIGIIPCGTGNDFIRSQKMHRDPVAALRGLVDADKIESVDIGCCNGSYFINVASVGIDAAIVKRTQQLKKWFKGPFVYLLASIIEILRYQPQVLSMTIDGVHYKDSVELVAIANGRFYGGGMEIAPMANTSDGMFDIILIPKMKRYKLLRLLPTLYSGEHIDVPEVKVYRGREIIINSTTPFDANIDGEYFSERQITIQPRVEKLNIYTII